MSLAAAILAAAVGSSGAPDPPKVEPMPNLYRPKPGCSELVERIVRRQETALRGRRGPAQYAVLRQVDGCMVPTPMGYHPDYLLPGAADPPATREDAPSNRR